MRYLALGLIALLIGCGPSLQARKDYVEKHNRPHYIEEAILNEKVVTGMNKSDVKASFGNPDSINESYYQGGNAQTQWCYRGGNMLCVYFENGTVTGWN